VSVGAKMSGGVERASGGGLDELVSHESLVARTRVINANAAAWSTEARPGASTVVQ